MEVRPSNGNICCENTDFVHIFHKCFSVVEFPIAYLMFNSMKVINSLELWIEF